MIDNISEAVRKAITVQMGNDPAIEHIFEPYDYGSMVKCKKCGIICTFTLTDARVTFYKIFYVREENLIGLYVDRYQGKGQMDITEKVGSYGCKYTDEEYDVRKILT